MKIEYTSKWLLQKLFATLFVLSLIYNLYSIHSLEFNDYAVISSWFKNYLNTLSVFIMFISVFLHSNIGLSSIIDDYFHDQIIKSKILLIKNFFFAVLLFITIFSLVVLVK